MYWHLCRIVMSNVIHYVEEYIFATLGSNSFDRSGLVLFAVNSYMVNITAISDVRVSFS